MVKNHVSEGFVSHDDRGKAYICGTIDPRERWVENEAQWTKTNTVATVRDSSNAGVNEVPMLGATS